MAREKQPFEGREPEPRNDREIGGTAANATTQHMRMLQQRLQGQVQGLPPGAEELAASALELAHLTDALARERQRAQALAGVVMGLNAGHSLAEVMQTAIARATQALGGERGGLLLLDERDGRGLRCARLVWEGELTATVTEVDELPNVKRALKSKTAIYVTLPEARGRESALLQSAGDWGFVAAPLIVGAVCIGLLGVSFRQEGFRLPEEDLAFAEMVAGQCALAIDRARAQEQAETARLRLEAVLEQLPSAVVIAEAPSGRVVLHNEQARRFWPPGAPMPASIEEYRRLDRFHPDGRPYEPAEYPLARAIRTGELVIDEELCLPGDGGPAYHSARAAPIRDDTGRIVAGVVVFTDITARKRAEQLREEYVHTLSHDLRTPLTIIQGQAQLILHALATAGLSDQPQRSAEAIIAGTRRMNAMIRDLADFARIESEQVQVITEPLDIRAFALDLKDRMEVTAGAERLRVAIPEGLPPVLADPDCLERVMMNLLTNALKYSAPSTEVCISAKERDGALVIAVVDRGQGVPPDMLPHLFERYYRTTLAKARREGLGLGLYITKRLVEAQGGRIWVESEPEKGSTFYFSLPVLTLEREFEGEGH